MQLRNVLVLAAMAPAALLAADLPYAGTWKLNLAKSELTGTTITYQKAASGEWEAAADGLKYKFKMDGKEYPDNLGDMVAWKEIDANTWETNWKTNGKPVSKDTLKLDAGSTLTVTTTGTKPNGEPINDSASLQRVSGGPGLAGKWKSKSVQSSSPEVIELVASGSDGLSYRMPSYSLSCDARLDGKDYPCVGPATPPGWAVAMTKTGATTFAATVKKDGKPLYKYTYMPSPDGKMLTVNGGATATTEKIKMVYDRQ